MTQFDWDILSPADRAIAWRYVPDMRHPDLTIASRDNGIIRPYLHRWHVVPRQAEGNVYFHIQVGPDPERPDHDHPWDNQTVMLATGYVEQVPHANGWNYHYRQKGDVVHRKATDRHRLELAHGHAYSMSQFTTGPVIREWGFWFTDTDWASYKDCCVLHDDGSSSFKWPERFKHLQEAA